jgi:hypothetical protein
LLRQRLQLARQLLNEDSLIRFGSV